MQSKGIQIDNVINEALLWKELLVRCVRQKYQFSFLNTQYSFEWDDLFTSCGSMTLHNVMMKLYEENVHMVQSVFTLSFNLIRLMCHGGEDSRGFRY